MAAHYQVDLNGEVYTVVDAETTVYWAVITGAVTDEIFGTLAAPGLAVELTRSDLASKALTNGTYAITAYPEQSFPKLTTTSYLVSYVLTAPGFRNLPMSVTVPVNASFPVASPVVAMRRLPVRIQGRVVNHATRLPVAGASIVSIDNPSAPPVIHTTALRSPLYFGHPGGASVQQVTIASTGSALLTQSVTGGDQILNLSTRTGLAANSIVRLMNAAGAGVEYGVVDHLGPGAASTPGEVFLRNVIHRSYAAAATTVDFINATPTGASATLSVDADAGDGVLLATQLFNQTVAIESGSVLEEIHELGAVSDSDGYYALDGMGRVREIFLQAFLGALQQTADWFVEYDEPINLVNFRI